MIVLWRSLWERVNSLLKMAAKYSSCLPPHCYKCLRLIQLLTRHIFCRALIYPCATFTVALESNMKLNQTAKPGISMHLPNTRSAHLMTRTTLSCLLATLLSMAPFAAQAASPATGASVCHQCGKVMSTRTINRPAAHGNGLGIATGAVVGGLLGNQIGGGNGRTLATVAGAVGGGYAGNVIEKRARSSTVTQVRVRMNNGAVRTFTEAGNSRWHAGTHVKVVNGALIARG
jgi:outer membrane lipoprotein SlyB